MFPLIRGAIILIGAKAGLLGTRAALLLGLALLGDGDSIARIAFALALAEMARLIADWGTDTWAIRAIAIAPDHAERARTVAASAAVKAGGGIFCAAIVVAVLITRRDVAGIALVVPAVLLILANQVVTLAIAYFQGTSNLSRLLTAVALPSTVNCALTLAVLYVTRSGTHAFFALAIGESWIALILMRALRGENALNAADIRFGEDARRVAIACLPAAMLSIIVGIYSRMDTMILAAASASALAAYTVAHRMFLPFQIGVTSLGSVLYGDLARSVGAGARVGRQFFLLRLPAIAVLAAFAALALWIIGASLIERYLQVYVAALPALQVLSLLLVLLACNAAGAAFVLAHGYFTTVFLIGCADFLITVIAMLAWVPRDGALGAAHALMLGAAANACLIIGVVTILALIGRRKLAS